MVQVVLLVVGLMGKEVAAKALAMVVMVRVVVGKARVVAARVRTAETMAEVVMVLAGSLVELTEERGLAVRDVMAATAWVAEVRVLEVLVAAMVLSQETQEVRETKGAEALETLRSHPLSRTTFPMRFCDSLRKLFARPNRVVAGLAVVMAAVVALPIRVGLRH